MTNASGTNLSERSESDRTRRTDAPCTRLAQLQRGFRSYVHRADAAMPLLVAGTERASVDARLQVYSDAYRLRLIEVLRKDFPGLFALAGEARFERLARAYVEAHPSRHFNARWYGQHLASFLRGAEWASAPVLAEMAELEWVMAMAFDAADETVADEAALAALAPECWGELMIRRVGASRTLKLRSNAPDLWKAQHTGQPLPAPARSDRALDWLVWRRALTVYYRRLEADEAWALEQARTGVRFGDLCEGLCDWHPSDSVPARAASLLKLWVSDELIARV